MKIDKVLDLIEKGFSAKTLSKLNESQLDVLHSRLMNEQIKQEKKQVTKTTIPASTARTTGANVDGVSIKMDNSGNIVASQTSEGEMKEDETDDVTSDDALGKDAMQSYTGQEAPHDANDMADDGMDDDSGDDRKMMGMAESKRKKGSKKLNPWAICTSQLGKEFGTRERHMWNAKEKNKYERCVKDVKQSLKEGKNPLSLYLENQITNMVEKTLLPRITKGDLLKYLSEAENFASKHIQPFKGSSKKEVGENGPATAPSKPKTSPTTKPGTKPNTRPRPKHPGKNPNPGENPAPKAKSPNVSPEKAKDKVLDLIMKILKK